MSDYYIKGFLTFVINIKEYFNILDVNNEYKIKWKFLQEMGSSKTKSYKLVVSWFKVFNIFYPFPFAYIHLYVAASEIETRDQTATTVIRCPLSNPWIGKKKKNIDILFMCVKHMVDVFESRNSDSDMVTSINRMTFYLTGLAEISLFSLCGKISSFTLFSCIVWL